jgi:hypothetical protein
MYERPLLFEGVVFEYHLIVSLHVVLGLVLTLEMSDVAVSNGIRGLV